MGYKQTNKSNRANLRDAGGGNPHTGGEDQKTDPGHRDPPAKSDRITKSELVESRRKCHQKHQAGCGLHDQLAGQPMHVTPRSWLAG